MKSKNQLINRLVKLQPKTLMPFRTSREDLEGQSMAYLNVVFNAWTSMVEDNIKERKNPTEFSLEQASLKPKPHGLQNISCNGIDVCELSFQLRKNIVDSLPNDGKIYTVVVGGKKLVHTPFGIRTQALVFFNAKRVSANNEGYSVAVFERMGWKYRRTLSYHHKRCDGWN